MTILILTKPLKKPHRPIYQKPPRSKSPKTPILPTAPLTYTQDRRFDLPDSLFKKSLKLSLNQNNIAPLTQDQKLLISTQRLRCTTPLDR